MMYQNSAIRVVPSYNELRLLRHMEKMSPNRQWADARVDFGCGTGCGFLPEDNTGLEYCSGTFLGSDTEVVPSGQPQGLGPR